MHKIPLIRPYLPQGTKELVNQVLDSGMLTEGEITRQLQDEIAAYIGCRHVLAVTNCTVGLEIALRALGIGPGDEVIVPDYTYPATADAVAIVGATAVIVDISPSTMLIDYDRIEQAITPRTRAIMPVSEFGNPLDYDRLGAIREKYGLFIVEDSACSLGSEFRGRKTGALADISVFSMHPRKFITSGEGGFITTDNDVWADFMNSYKHFGMKVTHGAIAPEFERIGTNYKLSNILAAVALGQFRQIGQLLDARLKLAARYISLLENKPGVTLPGVTPNGKHSYQTFSVFIPDRDRVLTTMRAQGIEVQFGTYALHMQNAFRNSPCCRQHGSFENSAEVFRRNLALPLYYGMSHEEQDTVIGGLLDVCAE